MINTVLFILSILGIIALCLLGLLLLVSALVLFWPIRYKVQGVWEESDKHISVKIRWLLGVLRITYIYPKEDGLCVKLFGISLLNKNKPGKKQDCDKNQAGEEIAKEFEPDLQPDLALQADSDLKPDVETKPDVEMKQVAEAETDFEIADKAEDSTLEERKPRLWERIKDSIRQFLFKIKGFCDKIKDIIRKIDYYKEVLLKQENKELLTDCLKKIGKIWKSLKPRVIDIKGVFGFESPDKTGMVYGAYCSIRPWLGKRVIISPDFEQSILQGKLLIKGRVFVFVLLINGLRIYFDKRLKKLIKQLKAGTGGVENDR